MSSTYNVRTGDTFETIARKTFGTEVEAGRIQRANPGVSEPLSAGTTIVIPDAPTAPTATTRAADPDEVALLLDGRRFRYWDSLRVTRSLDAMSTIELGAPFDHELPGFREAFRPLSFRPLDVTVGGLAWFAGTTVRCSPVIGEQNKIITASGYSRPGVLGDCTAPASMYPIEFNGQDLAGIARSLCGPFGLSVTIEGSAGAVFDRVALEPGKNILAFLIELAKQRNLLISDTDLGALYIRQPAVTGSPVAILRQGESPVLNVEPQFNEREYFSHVTGLEPIVVGLDGGQYTVKNPQLDGVIRPHVFDANDTQQADLQTAVEAKAGRMMANAISYKVQVATWRDPRGNLWSPNTAVKLYAPDAMSYSEFEFLVRSVEFERTPKLKTATLNLVLPGVFEGKLPEVLPWDG